MPKPEYEFASLRPDVPIARLRRGSLEHRQSVSLLRGHEGRSRSKAPQRFQLVKSGFIVRQRHVAERAANYAIYRAERGRVARVHYFPPSIGVESNATCNLRCPSCGTTRRTSRPAIRRASLELMKYVVDESHRRSFGLSFHHQGEPLLNPSFFEACAYAVKKGLWTAIHTNLSHRDPDLGRKIVESRLCNMVISCDGATQQTYEMYRRGGDLETVKDNLRAVVIERKRARSRLPWITAKFIVFDHNWHEMSAYNEQLLKLGADEVLFVQGLAEGVYATGRAASEQAFGLVDLTWKPVRPPTKCGFLWDGFAVNQLGNISPCCYGLDEDVFLETRGAPPSLMDAWNHPTYVAMRKHFLGEKRAREAMPAPCKTCEYTRP